MEEFPTRIPNPLPRLLGLAVGVVAIILVLVEVYAIRAGGKVERTRELVRQHSNEIYRITLEFLRGDRAKDAAAKNVGELISMDVRGLKAFPEGAAYCMDQDVRWGFYCFTNSPYRVEFYGE